MSQKNAKSIERREEAEFAGVFSISLEVSFAQIGVSILLEYQGDEIMKFRLQQA
jgi:hypothetical protein